MWCEHSGSLNTDMTLQKAPLFLIILATQVAYYPFEITVNSMVYRLHAACDSERCVYFDGQTWQKWDGITRSIIDTNKVCGFVHKQKCLVYHKL